MKFNGTLHGTLGDLLEVLDARTMVNVFVSETMSIKFDYVYSILADRDFLDQYSDRRVVGFSFGINTNILLEEV